MPRKFTTPTSVAQNRDSQRRSRARQRELMEDMRKQLQEYERRGVEASLEMQRTAREVARENRRLRIMLAARGILPDEIQAFLHLPDEAVNDLALDETARRRETRVPPLPSGSSSLEPLPSAEAAPSPALPSCSAVSSPCRRNSQSQITLTELRYEDGNSEQLGEGALTPHLRNGNGQDTPIRNETLDLSAPRTPRNPVATPLETSCAVAANIIADLHGDKDAAQALVALGCVGTSDCLIKNTKVFQLMDDIA